jgi:2-dehydro-3-deoxygalactonokinase
MTRLVAVDWGTSSLRAARIAADGEVLEERGDRHAASSACRPAASPPCWKKLCGDWLRQPDALCLVSGMAGSRQGWQSRRPTAPAPPASPKWAQAWPGWNLGRIALVPGLSCEHDGVPDVMRGEEVQIFGALSLTGLRDGVFVLPGTHSKWATVREGRGAVLPHLHDRRVLCAAAPAFDPGAHAAGRGRTRRTKAFLRGVRHAPRRRQPAAGAFSARTLALFERMAQAAQLSSYLSGLVIGEELRAQGPHAAASRADRRHGAHATLYPCAKRATGVATRTLGSEATWAGLHALSGFLAADNNTQP